MKPLIIFFKITGILALLIFTVVFIFIYTSGPPMPDDIDEIINAVLKKPMAELITGKTGIARSQGFNIWYESITAEGPSKGNILLIMGISNDALGWPQSFIRSFVGQFISPGRIKMAGHVRGLQIFKSSYTRFH